MQNYPDYGGQRARRDPYARNTYEEQRAAMREAKTRKTESTLSGLRSAMIACLGVVICLNAAWAVWHAGMLPSCESEPSPVHPGIVSPVSSATDAQAGVSEPVVTVNTAYGKVVPATGHYASLIDQYISHERSIMQQDEVVLTFTGDCTIGTWPSSSNLTNYTAVFSASDSPTYSFDNVKSLFLNDDYTYINLETTLTDATTQSEQTYAFKGNPQWAATMIAPSGVEGCNIANNHHYDWLEQGYTDTVNNVTAAGMDVGDEDHVIVTKCGELEIVLISGNYIWPTGRGKIIEGETLTNRLVEQVKQYKRPDNIVVVCAHWGLERQNICNYEQYDPARAFVDAGADMVIGHHPHTLQGVEVYNGKYIFYSLGNFAFGGKASTDEVNRVAMIVRPRFALREGTAVVTGLCVVPCYTTTAADIAVNNYQPRPLSGDEAKALADDLVEYSLGLKYGLKEDLECPTASFVG